MTDNTIAIIGAGLGGMTAALALQRSGVPVRVYEQSSELGEIGAGITMGPNATKALNGLGLEAALAEAATQVRQQGVLHYLDGRVLVENDRGNEPLKKYGAHYYQLHRADLHKMLVDAARENDSDVVVLNAAFKSLTQTTDGIEAHFADGSSVHCKAVVGCDGIKSQVRAHLFGDEAPRFTGRVAWRGLVPATTVPDFKLPLASAMFIAPDRSLGVYPIRNESVYNYVALCSTDAWAEEGWNVQSTPEEILEQFPGWYPPLLDLVRATPRDQCFKWGLFDRDPLDNWAAGKAVLLGDAAHAMLPYMGQGAAMAIEDGVVLARCFALESDSEAAIQRYMEARQERTALCQLESRAKGDRWEARETDSYDKSKHRNEESLGLFEYDAWTVEI